MKQRGIRRWLGVAVVPLTLLMLGVASPAQAASFACDNDQQPGGPPSIPTMLSETNRQGGDMTITRSTPGDCIIEHELFAFGFINISTMDGNIIFQGANKNVDSLNSDVNLTANNGRIAGASTDIKAGKIVTMTALGGPQGADGITLGDIIANTKNLQTPAEGDGNMLIVTDGNLSAGKIRANGTAGPGSKRSGSIQIDVNLNNPTSSFKIGGTGANVELIDTRSTDGGGTNVINVDTGIRITNGLPGATGGIEVDPDAIKVRNSNSRSGWLELNARKGTLKVLSGTLSSAGLNDNSAGAIYLLAQTIDFDANSKVTVSQSDTAPGVFHQIIIAAELIKFKGEEGLEILANGGGLADTAPAALYVFAEGGIESISNNNVLFYNWTIRFPSGSPFMGHEGLLHFQGEGTAPLKIAANGEQFSQIAIGGYPIIFEGGKVQIFAKGETNHIITMGIFDDSQFNNTQGIEFNNLDIVEINANGEETPGGNSLVEGGDISINSDRISFDSTAAHRVFVKGPSDVNGDGGTIEFIAKLFDIGTQAKGNFSADAPRGNAVKLDGLGRKAILFDVGASNFILGNAVKTINFSANGGGQTVGTTVVNGNAGAIELKTTGQINARNNSNLIDASSLGTVGDGGEITIPTGVVKFFVQNSPVQTSLRARGATNSGAGGNIVLPDAGKPSGAEAISVASHMNVNGGSTTAVGSQFGSITINGIKCQQFVFATSFPKTYWNCANTGTQGVIDRVPATTAQGIVSVATKSALDGKLELFIHTSPNQHKAFFDDDIVPLASLGLTFRHPENLTEKTHVSVFRSCFNCGDIPGQKFISEQQFREDSAHEIGHAVDRLVSPDESTTPTWNQYLTQDIFDIDSVANNTGGFEPRLPCAPTPDPANPGGPPLAGTPPFQGVKTYNSLTLPPVDVCVGNALNPVLNIPANTTNSDIFIGLNGALAPEKEHYAQTFAFRTSSNLNDTIAPMNNGVFNNGYYECTNARAIQLSTGTGTIPAKCN